MIRRFAIALVALASTLALGARAAPAPPAAAGPRAFVVWLYSHYPAATARRGKWDFTDPGVFDDFMIAQFREDTRLAKGEVGALDGDPLCECQDDSGLKTMIGEARMTAPTAAVVPVTLTYPGTGPETAEKLQLKLVIEHGGWRVYDVLARETPSFRQYIVKANHDHAAGKW